MYLQEHIMQIYLIYLCLSVVTLFAFLSLKCIALQLDFGIQAFKDATLFTCSDVS